MALRGRAVAGLRLLALLGVLLLVPAVVRADEHTHHYAPGEGLVLWADTVWPKDNRQETYEYFLLPFCKGTALAVDHYHESLGEALMGIELQNTGLNITWGQDMVDQTACRILLDAEKINIFAYAIQHDYQYRMFLDNLPIFGPVGRLRDGNTELGADELAAPYHLYTHRDITIAYNGDQVISVDIRHGNRTVSLEPNVVGVASQNVGFTYSVTWVPSTTPFVERFRKYLDSEFFEHRVHWYSIINSAVLVLFMLAIVMLVLMRTLRRDYARYERTEEGLLDFERDLGDEYGWKLVHGDVFRTPRHLGNFSALFGTGVQLLVLVGIVAFLAAWHASHEEKASLVTIGLSMYALTSFIAGYFSGRLYARYSGRNWVRTMFLAAAVWPGLVALVFAVLHFLALGVTSTRALSTGTILVVLGIWLFLIAPLTLFGAILGRNMSGLSGNAHSRHANFPARINPIPRPIPERRWYAEPLTLIFASGIVPFGSIFIELYFIFVSFWDDKYYYVYGVFMVIFVLLITVTACVSILSTYLLLNSEQHAWHWNAFFSGGSIALYVLLYAIHYYATRTKMHGWLQVATYFGYTGLICFALFCMMGTVGYLAAEWFVWRIYSNLKLD